MKWMVVHETCACEDSIGFCVLVADNPTQAVSKFLMLPEGRDFVEAVEGSFHPFMTGGPTLQLPGIAYNDIEFGDDLDCSGGLPYFGSVSLRDDAELGDDEEDESLFRLFIFPLESGLNVDVGTLRDLAMSAEAKYHGTLTESAAEKDKQDELELLEHLAAKHGKKLIDE